LTRSDIRQVRIDHHVGSNLAQTTLDVQRIHLWLFETGIAILTMELRTTNISLKLAQSLLDQVRRAYPAYFHSEVDANWKSTGDIDRAGHTPLKVTWLGSTDSQQATALTIGRPGEFGKDTAQSYSDAVVNPKPECPARIRLAEHWSSLLEPLVHGKDPAKPDQIWFEHIEDDRLPTLAYLAVKQPRSISPGDFERLAYLDEPGDSAAYSYNPAFLSKQAVDVYYDRFWIESDVPNGMAQSWPSMLSWMNTRLLVSGQDFVCVGDADDEAFFTNSVGGMPVHASRHYLKMFLLAHLQKASLLTFSHRLAIDAREIARDQSEDDRLKLSRERFTLLKRDFLFYSSRYLHTEITNQMQGRELYDMLARGLRIEQTYQELLSDIDMFTEMLEAQEERKQSDNTQRLTQVLGWLAVAALLVSLAALFSSDPLAPPLLVRILVGVFAALATLYVVRKLLPGVAP